MQYRYRETGGTWSEPANLSVTASSGKFTCADAVLPLDSSKSFEFEIIATDKLSSNTADATVDVGQAIFFISSNKKTCYLNGEEITTRNNVRELVNFNQLAEGTDLNTILTPGTYRSVQASHTATMSNTPAGLNGGFTLYVFSWSGNQTSTNHRRQELIYAQHTYIRQTLDGGATWNNWGRISLIYD